MRYGISYWKAHRWIEAARALESLPALSEALASGILGVDKIVELTRFATPKTEAELITMARAELKVHAGCPDGIVISVLRTDNSWEFRTAPTVRPSPNPAIPNPSRCWFRSATTLRSSMI